jgi:hypothetical protein
VSNPELRLVHDTGTSRYTIQNSSSQRGLERTVHPIDWPQSNVLELPEQ